jgi:hypothetical protein
MRTHTPRAQAAWVNTVVRQLHPYVDKAVADIVHAKLRDTFASLNLKKFGVASIALEHFSLGVPPKIAGIKAWCAAACCVRESIDALCARQRA